MRLNRLTALLTILVLPLAAGACSRAGAGERQVVVATTSMIGGMVDRLAGDELDTQVLIPPGACPGHFDLRPGDAVGLSRAGLVIRHHYQGYLDSKLSAQNPELEIVVLRHPPSLVVPESYALGLARVDSILRERFPAHEKIFAANLDRALGEVRDAGAQARGMIGEAGFSGMKVLASVRQAHFARWSGLDVVAEFPNTPEELSVRLLHNLAARADSLGAQLVVGNLQSGGELVAGSLARETGLPAAVLSNFPGTNEHNRTWRELLFDNIDRLRQAADKSLAGI